jgi:hypothetical protein
LTEPAFHPHPGCAPIAQPGFSAVEASGKEVAKNVAKEVERK